MKRLLITTFIALTAILMTAMPAMASQATLDRLIDQLSNDNSVTMVYLSPALIKSFHQLDPTGYNLNKISQHATSIKVFVCGSAGSQATAEQYVRERQKMSPKPSLLTKIRNRDSLLEIYGVPKGNQKELYSSVIFLSKKDGTSRMMIFEGEFEPDDISSLSSQTTRINQSGGRSYVYPPTEPVISRILKSDSHPHDLEVEFSDPSGRLAEEPIVNVRYDGDLHTYRAFYKKIVGGKAVYKFYIPMKYLNKNRNTVVFYLDNRKYTRSLE